MKIYISNKNGHIFWKNDEGELMATPITEGIIDLENEGCNVDLDFLDLNDNELEEYNKIKKEL